MARSNVAQKRTALANARRPVRDFRCDVCCVRIKGAMGDDGVIRATNRPYTDSTVERCTCMTCVARTETKP